MLEFLIANLPMIIAFLGSIGALAFLAGHIRRGVVEARKAALKTKTKVDDVLVDVVDGPLLELADMIERGDLAAAQRKIVVIQDAVAHVKSKPSL